jgi:hypothetical protein
MPLNTKLIRRGKYKKTNNAGRATIAHVRDVSNISAQRGLSSGYQPPNDPKTDYVSCGQKGASGTELNAKESSMWTSHIAHTVRVSITADICSKCNNIASDRFLFVLYRRFQLLIFCSVGDRWIDGYETLVE